MFYEHCNEAHILTWTVYENSLKNYMPDKASE